MIPARGISTEGGERASCRRRRRFLNIETGEVIQASCGARLCPACGPGRYRPRLMARLYRGIPEDLGVVTFATFTAPSFCDAECRQRQAADNPLETEPAALSGRLHSGACKSGIARWNQGAPKRWNHLWTLVKRTFPAAQMFKIWESQKRGALHVHVLIRGAGYVPEDVLRRLAVRAGWGVQTDSQRADRKATGYIAKYVLKSIDAHGVDVRRVWSCSVRWARGEWWPKRRRGGAGWVYLGVTYPAAGASQSTPRGLTGGCEQPP